MAIDGKTLRGSFDAFLGQTAIQMVSAWASGNHMVLGQVKVKDKSNEITAIPVLLQLLDVKGCIVTLDAMGCQKDIAQAIVAKGSDYVLAVKENQAHLFEELGELFSYAAGQAYRDIEHSHGQIASKGHGRLEVRRCWAISTRIVYAMFAIWPGGRACARWFWLNTNVTLVNESPGNVATTFPVWSAMPVRY